jgi:outer membrane beta-barrel protein
MKATNSIVWITLAMMWVSPAAFAKAKQTQAADQTQTQDATTAAPQSNAAPPSEKLDVTDLENKYWAPKDTDFSVVQNRTYSKEHKLFISAQFGPDLNQTYLAGNQVGLNVNYFQTERYGFQATYLKSYLHSSRELGDLTSYGGGIQPNHGVMQDYYGLGFNWVPFYSKMSFLGKKILYFDMAITPTIGMTTYDQMTQSQGNSAQNALTYGVDITQYYFFSNHFALRADLKNQWYNERIVQYAGTSQGAGVKSQLDREMIFLIGFSYYFGLSGH